MFPTIDRLLEAPIVAAKELKCPACGVPVPSGKIPPRFGTMSYQCVCGTTNIVGQFTNCVGIGSAGYAIVTRDETTKHFVAYPELSGNFSPEDIAKMVENVKKG